MTYGFLMPLATDLKVENGEFTWDTGWPGGEFANITRSPIGFHDGSQVDGTPFFDEDQFIIKFNNFWTIQLPPGYSLLVTPSDQPRRPAVPRLERAGRLRPLSRRVRAFPGALGRSGFQRRAAEGHAGGAMPADQARELVAAIRQP